VSNASFARNTSQKHYKEIEDGIQGIEVIARRNAAQAHPAGHRHRGRHPVRRRSCTRPDAGLRSALKYQDQPKGPQRCDNCMHWVPGASPTAKGGCKVIPGDKEISPQGWCTAWAATAAKK
jgi:hypothetical protein